MKPATTIASLLLMALAGGQLVRAVSGWPVTIDGFSVPVWLSFVAAAVLATVGAMSFREARRV